MEAGVVMMFYNEIDALKVCIPRLLEIGVDKILLIDGKFEHFPGKGQLSTDGSREYLAKFKECEVIDMYKGDIFAKTNMTFIEGSKRFDVALRLDCDEIVYGDWHEFCQTLEIIHNNAREFCYKVPFYDLDGYYNLRSTAERIVVDFSEMRCKYRHWINVIGHCRIRANYCIGGLTIIHDSRVRSAKREAQMDQFQKNYNWNIEFKGKLPKMQTTEKKMET